MKRVLCLLLAAVLLLGMTACSGTEKKWQEQYDLGMRYLEDGDYEEAILAFSAAIEIDDSRPEAYMGRAEAYIAVNEPEKALKDYKKAKKLAKKDDDEDLADELEELINELEEIIENQDENSTDSGQDATWDGLSCVELYNEGGSLIYRHEFSYDAEGRVSEIVYCTYSGGTLMSRYSTSFTYDDEDRLIRAAYGDTGEMVYNYDSQGRLVSTSYVDGGWVDNTYEYGENGNLLRSVSENQVSTSVTEYTCDDAGRIMEARTVTTHEYGTSESLASYTYDVLNRIAAKTEVWAEGTHYTSFTYLKDLVVEVMTFDYTYESDLLFRIQDVEGHSQWAFSLMEGTYTTDEMGRVIQAEGYAYDDIGLTWATCFFRYGDEQPSVEMPDEETAVDAYSTYKNYFYANFSDTDEVYLADVTHDGQLDMMVVNFSDEYRSVVYGHVYTIQNGSVVEIFSKQGSDYHAGGFFAWYLVPVPDSDFYNLAEESFGMWQGIGTVTYREYLLTQEGYAIEVNYLKLDSEDEGNHDSYGMVTEAAWSAYTTELNRELANCYRIYCSSSNGNGGNGLDTNPLSVFSK